MSNVAEPNQDPRADLSREIHQASEPFRNLIQEVGKMIVGQQGLIHRMLVGLAGQWSLPH